MAQRFQYIVTIDCETRDDADQVIAERIGPDEDYGFEYRIDWDHHKAPCAPEPAAVFYAINRDEEPEPIPATHWMFRNDGSWAAVVGSDTEMECWFGSNIEAEEWMRRPIDDIPPMGTLEFVQKHVTAQDGTAEAEDVRARVKAGKPAL